MSRSVSTRNLVQRSTLRLLGLAAFVLGFATSATAQSETRPNIVFIIADDLGWAGPRTPEGTPIFTPDDDYVEPSGHKAADYETPHIAQLAAGQSVAPATEQPDPNPRRAT